uniref:Uncharacterized protein n=1 Tax=Oryza meridionalis TaxID=40149 RepID=A0A0E0C7V9_9ORYZ
MGRGGARSNRLRLLHPCRRLPGGGQQQASERGGDAEVWEPRAGGGQIRASPARTGATADAAREHRVCASHTHLHGNLTACLATIAGAVVNNSNGGKLPGLSRKLFQKAPSEHKKNALTEVKSGGNTRALAMVLRGEWVDEIAALRLQFEQKDIELFSHGDEPLSYDSHRKFLANY